MRYSLRCYGSMYHCPHARRSPPTCSFQVVGLRRLRVEHVHRVSASGDGEDGSPVEVVLRQARRPVSSPRNHTDETLRSYRPDVVNTSYQTATPVLLLFSGTCCSHYRERAQTHMELLRVHRRGADEQLQFPELRPLMPEARNVLDQPKEHLLPARSSENSVRTQSNSRGTSH